MNAAPRVGQAQSMMRAVWLWTSTFRGLKSVCSRVSPASSRAESVGDCAGFRVAICRAWREMDTEYSEELPSWLKFVNRSEIAVHEARGHWYLGDPSTAVDLYRASLQVELSPRNEAATRANLATALAAAGDFSGAFTEATAVLPALEDGNVRSMRTVKRLRPVRQLAERHSGGADFCDRFDQIARGANSA